MKIGIGIGIGRQNRRINAGPPLDPFTQAWVSRVEANGGTVSAERALLFNATFVPILPILQKFDWANTGKGEFHIWTAENEETARTNILNDSFYASPVASPAFSADAYYMLDGSSQVLDLTYNPSTLSLPSANNMQFMLWDGAPSPQATIGALTLPSPVENSVYMYATTSGMAARNRTAAEKDFNLLTNTNMTVMRRDGDDISANDFDSEQVLTDAVDGPYPNLNYYMGGINTPTGTLLFTNGNAVACGNGATLTDIEMETFYNAIKSYCLTINPTLTLP